ncbi:MAG TPA: hypothetical protein VI542_05515, partial [Candidatus Tectomicrobia bacterium]
ARGRSWHAHHGAPAAASHGAAHLCGRCRSARRVHRYPSHTMDAAHNTGGAARSPVCTSRVAPGDALPRAL